MLEYVREVESLAQDAYMAWYLTNEDTSEEFSALVQELDRLESHEIVSDVDYGRVRVA
jgi:hypothetical protein